MFVYIFLYLLRYVVYVLWAFKSKRVQFQKLEKQQYRSVIRFLSLEGKSRIEIKERLYIIYGNRQKLFNHFKNSPTSVFEDQTGDIMHKILGMTKLQLDESRIRPFRTTGVFVKPLQISVGSYLNIIWRSSYVVLWLSTEHGNWYTLETKEQFWRTSSEENETDSPRKKMATIFWILKVWSSSTTLRRAKLWQNPTTPNCKRMGIFGEEKGAFPPWQPASSLLYRRHGQFGWTGQQMLPHRACFPDLVTSYFFLFPTWRSHSVDKNFCRRSYRSKEAYSADREKAFFVMGSRSWRISGSSL